MAIARRHLVTACAAAAAFATGAALAVGDSQRPPRIRTRLDPTFADNGIASFRRMTASGLDSFRVAKSAGDTDLYLAGNFPAPAIVRMHADGTPDESFGVGGAAAIRLKGSIADFEVAAGIVVVGQFGPPEGSDVDGAIGAVRLLTDGSGLDTSFGAGGMLSLAEAGQDSRHRRLYALADARLGGSFVALEERDSLSTVVRYGIVRFSPDGVLDASFAGNGFAEISVSDEFGVFGSGGDPPRDIAVDSSGRIVVTGHLGTIRFLADGTRDLSFGIGGRLVDRHAAPAHVQLFGLDADDRITALVRVGDRPKLNLCRWNGDGLLDTSFGRRGAIAVPIRRGTTDYFYYSLTLAGGPWPGPAQSDRIVLAGGTSNGPNGHGGRLKHIGWFACYVDETQSRTSAPLEQVPKERAESRISLVEGGVRSGTGVVLTGSETVFTDAAVMTVPFLARVVDER